MTLWPVRWVFELSCVKRNFDSGMRLNNLTLPSYSIIFFTSLFVNEWVRSSYHLHEFISGCYCDWLQFVSSMGNLPYWYKYKGELFSDKLRLSVVFLYGCNHYFYGDLNKPKTRSYFHRFLWFCKVLSQNKRRSDWFLNLFCSAICDCRRNWILELFVGNCIRSSRTSTLRRESRRMNEYNIIFYFNLIIFVKNTKSRPDFSTFSAYLVWCYVLSLMGFY